MKLDILFEDRHLLVLYKPAGVAVQSARVGTQDCESILKNYLYQKEQTSKRFKSAGGGVPYLGLVHRLDQPVEGLLVFALDKKTAAALSKQVSQGGMEKIYLAVRTKTAGKGTVQEIANTANTANTGMCKNRVGTSDREIHVFEASVDKSVDKSGILEEKRETTGDNWTTRVDYLWKNGRTNRSEVVGPSHPGAKKAVLSYRVLAAAGARELVEIKLVTGRHHQIRVQMAAMGTPIVGDIKYGAQPGGYAFPALCAYRLLFTHPATGEKMEFQIPPRNPAFAEFEAYYPHI